MERDPQEVLKWQRLGMAKAICYECDRLFATGILSANAVGDPLFRAAVTQTLIYLNDLLQKAKDDGNEIAFSDHINITEKVKNITDLVRQGRNAASHMNTGLNDVDFGRFQFGVSAGRGAMMQVDGQARMENEFDDDIAIFFGDMRIYVERHMRRALREVRTAFDC